MDVQAVTRRDPGPKFRSREIPGASGAAAFDVAPAADARTFIAADVGGTHARLALVAWSDRPGVPQVIRYEVFRCADHPHLEDIIRCFCESIGQQPEEMVLACAGYEHAGAVVNRNLPWPVVTAHIAESMDLRTVRLLNDFEALGYAISHLDASNTALLKSGQGRVPTDRPAVIIGPGTGLGAAVRLPGSPDRVIVTEAGQVQLSTRTRLERDVLIHLGIDETHVPFETVLSGPGLHRIYRVLCALRDRYPVHAEPAEITAAALADPSSLAGETLALFCGWLGSFAGDLALVYGATGGVFLAGGFLSQILPFMQASDLVHRFLDKGVMRPFLNRIPIHVVDHGQLGVIGAASWFLHARNGTAQVERPSVECGARFATPGDRK